MTSTRETLKVNLVNQEKGYYSNMFKIANPEESTNLPASQAVIFFSKSGLPMAKLRDVWTISAQTSNDYLTRDEFYIALKLIAYAQNGIRSDAEAIRLKLESPLPTFDGSGSSGPPKQQPVQNPLPDPSKDLPDLDDLDFSVGPQVSAIMPSLAQPQDNKSLNPNSSFPQQQP